MTALHKVLVVDDDPVVHKSFDKVLSGKGYAVITAANGDEALRKLTEEKYDVVYTDIRMPGMDGLEVAEQVKAQMPWTPVVIITGYGTDAAEARAKAAGVANFLHKPLTPEMIEGSARQILAAPATVAEAAVLPAPAEVVLAETAEEIKAEAAGIGMAVKNIALFLAAPFIALAYVIALPFVGLGILAVLAARAAARSGAVATIGHALGKVGLFLAAPFIALAYVVLFPLIGLVVLAWIGGRAWVGAGTR